MKSKVQVMMRVLSLLNDKGEDIFSKSLCEVMYLGYVAGHRDGVHEGKNQLHESMDVEGY